MNEKQKYCAEHGYFTDWKVCPSCSAAQGVVKGGDREALRVALERVTEIQKREGGIAWKEAQALLCDDLDRVADGLVTALRATPSAPVGGVDKNAALAEALGLPSSGIRDGKRIGFAWEYLIGMVSDMMAYYERHEAAQHAQSAPLVDQFALTGDEVRAIVKSLHGSSNPPQGSDFVGAAAAYLSRRAQSAPLNEPVTDEQMLAAFNSADSVIDGLHEVLRLARFAPDWAGYRQGLADGKAEQLSEEKRDAERWRFLAPKFTGFDFDWMPSEPDARDGKNVLCFDMGREFSFSVDVAGDIDAAIAKGDGND